MGVIISPVLQIEAPILSTCTTSCMPFVQPMADCMSIYYHGNGIIENLYSGGTCASSASGVQGLC